jgi:hypothetical protein
MEARMNLYLAARILHIVGALALFMALGIDLAGVTALGRARAADEVRGALAGYRLNGIIGPISLLLLLVPGIYMATTAWAWPAWTIISFWTLVAIAVLGATVTRRRIAAVAQALKGDDRGLSADLERLTHDPLLRTSFVLRTMLALGIVALMTMKPDVSHSLLVLLVAIGTAAIVSTPFWTQRRKTARA